MRSVLAWLAAIAAVAPAVAERYHTDMVMRTSCAYGDAHLNNHGDYAVGLWGPTGLGIYVDGVSITPKNWTLYVPCVTGISDSGDVAWTDYVDPQDGVLVACKNTTILFQSVGIDYVYSETADINASGHVAWFGQGPGNRGYIDQTPLQDYLGLPSAAGSGPLRINDGGQVLWIDRSYRDLWVGTTNLTQGMLGYGWNYYTGKGFNNNGDVLWDGCTSTGGYAHVYLNRTDLTAMYAPYSDVNAGGVALNDGGHVLWGYERMSIDDRGTIMLDGTDIATPVLGRRGHINPVGLNGSGQVLWAADDASGRYCQTVYVNDYDLSDEALPGHPFQQVFPCAINNRGQVLWRAKYGDTDFRYYLSTPVPEPPVLLLGLPLIAAFARRRKSAG